MRKFNLITVVAVFSLLLQSCATDKAFVKRDLMTIPSLKVVRYETPSIRKQTFGGAVISATTGVLLAGGLGGYVLSDAVAKSGGKTSQGQIYDFGYLIMTQFCDRASKEIPNWSVMNVVAQPVKDDYTDPGVLLEFKVNRIIYGWLAYKFLSQSTVTLKDSNGDILWQKDYRYKATDFNREFSAEEYEADNAKLLKEEIQFAADKTVSDFIDNFKNGKQ